MSRATSAEEHILVLAPTGRDAALTCALLGRAGIACTPCESIEQLCQRFERDGAAALMVAEEVFGKAGLARLRETLAKQSAWSDVPVLIFTGTAAHGSVRTTTQQQLASLGNVTLLDRPLRPITMLSAARTALRARERQYRTRAELLEQQRAVRERDQFLAMLGHELRNPLSAIAMAMELDKADHSSKYSQIMARQVDHLTRLVDDLLDVSRVTSGKIVPRREPVELVELTRRCVGAIAPSLPPGTQLEHNVGLDMQIWISADAVRIEQVVNNLINNAIKYTPRGGRIDVSVASEADEAILRVSDTGVGLEPEMLERIFDLFTQVEASLDRSKGGMGIGLTLVRNLIALHGGTVSAASAGLGRGSVFTVRLPRTEPPVGVAPSVRALSSPPRSAQPPDVGIVEDNEDSRELLATILSRRGYRVFTAEDGLRGVEEALARRPRVLLVDVGLPGLDGYGVARRVREGLGQSVFLVALTGYGQPEDRLRAAEAGFDLHLTKPVDVSTLDRVLSRSVLSSASAPAE